MQRNISNNKLDNGEKSLLGILSKELFDSSYVCSDDDYLAAIKEAKKQAVYMFAAKNAPGSLQGFSEIKSLYLKHLSVNMRVHANHHLIHELMTGAGIPYVVLKGASSAFYYHEMILRSMGDVDFLVHPEDVEKAKKVLLDAGLVNDGECDHHIGFVKGHDHFELHFVVNGIPNGEVGEVVRGYLSDIIETAKAVNGPAGEICLPTQFHHGLVMLLHMQRHMRTAGMGLRHLCDWAVFVDKFTDSEFREMFEEKLTACGLWSFACFMSLAANVGMGLRYREFMGTDTETALILLSDIMDGGNFGRKDVERTGNSFFMNNVGESKTNRFTNFVSNINGIVYNNWPFVKKWKILLPFMWVFVAIRRLVRELLGKRKKIDFVSSFKSSKNRNELYKKLGLFETLN